MSGATKMCPNGHVMDATWDRCPYCPDPTRAPRPPVPPTRVAGAAPPPGMVPGGFPPPPPGPPPGYPGAPPYGAPPPPPAPPHGAPPGFQAAPPAAARPKAGGAGRKTRVFAAEEAAEKKVPVVGWLVALTGKHKGEDFRIREGKNTIGSSPDCDIVLTDDYVSSKHARINYIQKGDERVFVLVDLDSANGTYLNDSEEPVYHEELVDNDTITFGRTKCKFKCL
ncbi:MAG: hypothetical protein KatS3mg102_2069 [Planctomycetota bacterium]|nr:MAG: hypothetical protein KatS3mg102_2069 [Planctomycetota bacterium]